MSTPLTPAGYQEWRRDAWTKNPITKSKNFVGRRYGNLLLTVWKWEKDQLLNGNPHQDRIGMWLWTINVDSTWGPMDVGSGWCKSKKLAKKSAERFAKYYQNRNSG